MAKESKIICKSNFKNSNQSTLKSEFNEKIAKLISRAENHSFFIGDWRDKK